MNACVCSRKAKPIFLAIILLWIVLFLTMSPYSSNIIRSVPYAQVLNTYKSDTAVRPVSMENTGDVEKDEQLKLASIEDTPVVDTDKYHKHSSYGHCESVDFMHSKTVNKTSIQYFTKDFKVSEIPIVSWLDAEKTFCDSTVKTYADKIGILQNVVINPKERLDANNLAKGGESIREVKLQNIHKEDYIFKPGFFRSACNHSKDSISLDSMSHRKLKHLAFIENNMTKETYRMERNLTIAIVRGDYANLWNHMFELYGVFVVMVAFNKRPDDVSILFLDGHPSCLLDKNWEHIFGPVQRVGHFKGPVLFNELIIGLDENQIPLSKWEKPTCPYIEEFRTFVLNQYDIVEDAKRVNCNRLTFTFVVRRNQVYHPRNLEGNVERKIFNELEVIETLMEKFPGVCIQALLMESIPMRAQLEIISETDILIGMHGAGMMHTTFLPRHAGVVELFPYKWRTSRKHSVMYEVLSLKWRKLKYHYWQNTDKERQFSEKITIVDTDQIHAKVKSVVDELCP